MTTLPEAKQEAAKIVFEFETRVQSGEFDDPDGHQASVALEHMIEQALQAAEKRVREEAAKQMAELKEERDHLLEIGSKAVKFQLGDVFVESRGLGIWAVCNGGCVRNVLGEWEYEPFPSGRDDEFIARTRFPFAEAWEIAAAIRSTN